jgi:DNA-directed RNA polymerase specialized sigma24 family protein
MELAAAFRVLSEADREVLRLAAREGLGAEEIGAVVGCSAIAAKARLRRARRPSAERPPGCV